MKPISSFDGVCGVYMDFPRVLLTLGAALSIISFSIIFALFYYYKIPNLRRHPTTINIHKCWFELIFISQFLWISFAPNDFFWESYNDNGREGCHTNTNIWPLAWLCQFSLLGGELWFAVLSVDIHQSLVNPFTSYQVNAQNYTLAVYGIAIFVATVFVSVVPIQYGLSVDPMIWVNNYHNPAAGLGVKFAIFYVFMIMIYFYSGTTAIWARFQIHKGLEDTLAVRKYSISKQTRYVIGYFLFWTLFFLLQFLNYVNTGSDIFTNPEDDHIRSASAFLLASRGTWTLAIFLIANWLEITTFFRNQREGKSIAAGKGPASPPKVEQEQVQLNVALQTEIVRFTVLGIQKAIRDVEESMLEQERLSTGGTSFFNPRRTGEAFSFMLKDDGTVDDESRDSTQSTEHDVEAGRTRKPKRPSNNPATDATSAPNPATTTASVNNALHVAASAMAVERCESPLRSLQLASAATAASGGSIYRKDRDDVSPSRNDSFMQRSGSLFRKSETINFAFHDEEMIRQDSSSQGSVRLTNASTGTGLIGQLSSHIRQRFSVRRSAFLFTDYSPKQFAKMREVTGIQNEDYLDSFKSTTMPSFSEGRSGAFLYFSSDRKYIVKTTTQTEFTKLLNILPEYVQYFVDQQAQGHQPLVTRFLGAHKIVMYDIPLYFVIMQNICPSVQEKYDLKGSWVNRHSSKKKDYNPKDSRPKKFSILQGDKQRSLNRKNDGAQLFLDNDLQNCFLLDPKISKVLADQILRDIKMLAGFNLMDYSLLVGIKRRNFEVIDSSPTAALTKSHLDTAAAAAAANGSQGPVNPIARLQGQNKNSTEPRPTSTPLSVAGSTATSATAATGVNAVHNVPMFTPAFKDPDGAMHAAVVEGQGTFYIGIIDILQEWNYDKWYERMVKKYVLRKDAAGLSAMDPLNYRKRFYQRAVLDVFDGLGLEDADDNDIFERYSTAHFPGEGDPLRDTVDTAISGSRGHKDSRGMLGTLNEAVNGTQAPQPVGSPHSSRHEFLTGPLGGTARTELTRESEVSASESSSFSHEVQLQSFQSSAFSGLSRDPSRDLSRDSNTLSPTGTDRRFAVKPLAK